MLSPLNAIEFVESNFYKSVESHYHFLMRVRKRKRFEFINTVIQWRSDRESKNGQFLLLPESYLQKNYITRTRKFDTRNYIKSYYLLRKLHQVCLKLQNTRLRMHCFWKNFHLRQKFGHNDFISGWTIYRKLSNVVQTRHIVAQNWHHTQTSSPSYLD